jgi:dethiobiotin synthetase/adenosylmethionine--8-amino-7-oxononanoate aminotransferase
VTANTDVGKTLLTTALVRSTALRYQGAGEAAAQLGQDGSKKRVFYLKPVSTGPDNESDVRYVLYAHTSPMSDRRLTVSYVERHTGDLARIIETRNLYQYREPMSPHLAAKLAPDLVRLLRDIQLARQRRSPLSSQAEVQPSPKSNAELVQGVSRYATERSHGLNAQQGALYVETAGGA